MTEDLPAEQSPDYRTILLRHDGSLTWIVLNRPERLNALSAAMLAEIEAALEHLRKRRATRVIAIRGEGRAFCAGYDVERDADEVGGADQRSPVRDSARLERNIETFMRIWRYPKPVIAAVHGYCIAGGIQLATLCDITVIAEDTKLGIPSVPLGGGYISPMLVPLVGPKRAKQLSFQPGPSIDGRTAVEWGWANYAVPEVSLWDEVAALARSIARTPADVLAVKKAAINRAADIAGWSTIMPLGGETDALLHEADSVRFMRAQIMANGLKTTIRQFRDGELQDQLDEFY